MSQPQPEPIMQFFAYSHLPPALQVVSEPFGKLAEHLVETLPRNAERTVALRKLLEAKDAAVRAKLAKEWDPIACVWVGPRDPNAKGQAITNVPVGA